MTTESTDTDTETTEHLSGAEVVGVSAELEAFNSHVKSLAIEDDVDVAEKVLRQILAATTADDILRAGEAVPAEAILNVPITVHAIRASESGFVDGADYYLHIEATINSNGDAITVSCGSSDVAMKLVALDMRGLLPVRCRIERSQKATKRGFFPLFLRPLDASDEPF